MTEPITKLGSEQRPLCVAIVGSGPAGFYAAEALLRSSHAVRISMLERLPTPFGLVRGGVAPDHPKIKQVSLVYDRIAHSPGFAFLGNVMVGRDVSIAELCDTHHAVIIACGAEVDRRLGIPGETLPGSHTATEFVGWYNGHPDYRDRTFDLSGKVAVVVGQGNVAADVCRILAMPADALRQTDIAEHAMTALARSGVREVHVIGRRGPAQAKFTPAELRELGEIEACDALVEPNDLILNPNSAAELGGTRGQTAAKNIEILRRFATRPAQRHRRCIRFHFLRSPVAIEGSGRVKAITLSVNRLTGAPLEQLAEPTDKTVTISCDLVFRSIGYRGLAVPGVSFDDQRGTIPNRDGRVLDERRQEFLPGLYVTGWIKRGPSGIIGTNRADSVATVQSLLEDLPRLDARRRPGADGLWSLLNRRRIHVVTYAHWQRIDDAEVARGKPKSKPREKFTRTSEMLAVLD